MFFHLNFFEVVFHLNFFEVVFHLIFFEVVFHLNFFEVIFLSKFFEVVFHWPTIEVVFHSFNYLSYNCYSACQADFKLFHYYSGLNENKAKLSPPAEAGTGAWLSLAMTIWQLSIITKLNQSFPQASNPLLYENCTIGDRYQIEL